MSQLNVQCPIKCELSLRWGLPCRHWMYLVFINKTFIPCSLIHPRWFFDGPERIQQA